MSKETTILDVEGMTCSHCENAIKRAVGAIDGVDSVAVDLKEGSVTVGYDPRRTGVKTIKDAIEDQGYGVKRQPE